jgi:hypothetical protein
MLVFLPVVSLLLIFLAFRFRSKSQSWREAFLATFVLLGTITVLVTEGLSLFHGIAFLSIACYWCAVALGAAGFLYVSIKNLPEREKVAGEKPTFVSRLLFAGVALYVLILAVIALMAPPNTWDSMEYHMPKVMHWIQNGSVSFYPTAIRRQNILSPGAEYAVMHLQLLSGSDRFANFAEWFGMLGSLVATSLIARQLGAPITGQLLAAVFAVTIPMGIMQASSTQTDYVVAFWFACFVYYFLRLREADTFHWPFLLGLSASLGLAVFAKATAYIFGPAFLLWLALSQIRTYKWQAIRSFVVTTAIFVAINAGHCLRNWDLYRNPLGPCQEPNNATYSLDSHAPNALLSSLAKNIGTHINTPWASLNASIQQCYVTFHQWIGIELDDPRTTWAYPPGLRFEIQSNALHDEMDGNPFHLLLAIVCGFLLPFFSALRKDRTLLMYAAAVAAAFLLNAFYCKWHPWMSRLHMTLFVLMAPMVGVVLARILPGKAVNILAMLLLLLGLPWLLFCQQRPVMAQANIFNTSRERLYFKTPHQSYESAFMHGREFLRSRNVSQVGLVTGNSSWEYPWWVLLHQDNPSVRLEHVNVDDASSRIYAEEPFCSFQPDAVISLDQTPQVESITVGHVRFEKQWAEGGVAIYLREAAKH